VQNEGGEVAKTFESTYMKPLSSEGLAKLKMLRLRTNSPLKRKTWGQLLAVLRTKLADGPGINTALKSEIFGKMRSDLDLDSSSLDCISFSEVVALGKI
jgi:hypothetical protein